MNTEEFLDILQQRKLASESELEGIRSKVQQGDHRITAKSVLKFLVKQEVISPSQAQQLLNTTLTVTGNAESSILGIGWDSAPTSAPSSAGESQIGSLSLDSIPTLQPVDSIDSESAIEDIREPSRGYETLREEKDNFIVEASPPPMPPMAPPISPHESFSVADVTKAQQEKDEEEKKGKKKSRKKKNEWDSPLLLIGGGGLFVLVFAGVIVWFLLNRENADTILSEAGDFFDSGSYTQAIKQYEKFVDQFPSHPQYSAAKIQLGMTRLWNATQGGSKFPEALSMAKEVLDELKNEPAFRDAQDDLAALLPDIAQGLAKQAEKTDSPDEVKRLVELTEMALSLCANTKYIPEQYRDEVVLGEIEQALDLIRRSQEHKALLQEALSKIQQEIDSQEITKAYSTRRDLLKKAPGLLNSEELASKLREISAAEQLVIKHIIEPRAAETTPRPSKVVASLALADLGGKPIADNQGSIAVRIDGTLYSLSTADGSLLWHKHVGIGPSLPPQLLANGDLLVVNSNHNELLRLNGESGKLIWRQEFEKSIASPTIDNQRILVAESSGKLYILDLADGNRTSYVQFAQPILVPATIGTEGKVIYVAGEHSSLFTLTAEDFSCLGVHYLGHDKGNISVPLFTVLNKVVVAVNTGKESSQLSVISTTENGVLSEIVGEQRLTGLVNTKLHSSGRRLVALTSSGQITVNEISADNDENAFITLASREADGNSLVARFGLLHDGSIWSAGNQLNKMAILPTGNRLPMQNIDNSYKGDFFDHALQVSGSSLIHVRRPTNTAGALVAAMNLKTGKAAWETHLAMPPAGPPAIDPQGPKISVATSSGAAFSFDRETLRSRVQNQASHLPTRSKITLPVTTIADLGQGRFTAGAPGAKTILHYVPGQKSRLTTIELADPLSSLPVTWGNHFVVPTSSGQVFLYDSENGKQVGTPFQPALKPGDTYQWLPATISGTGEESRLILSDGRGKIYVIAQSASPSPHLSAEAEADVGPSPPNTRFAAVGETGCAGSTAGEILRLQLPTLAPLEPLAINAQIAWGPFAVGDQILCSTDTNELICLDNQAAIAWRQPLAHGRPVGMPVAGEDTLFIAWQSGGLSKLSSADGVETGHIQLESPVVAGPVALGKRFILSSPNGTLFVVDRP